MTEQEQQKALLSGKIYGECAYWITLAGMVVGIIGIVMYLFGVNQFFDPQILMNGLWEGKDAEAIWQEAAKSKEILYGHWYLSNLAFSDGIAMLGIGICCISAVVGAWGSFFGMIINKEKPYIYIFFVLIIAVILVLSAAGFISIH